jgi:NAD(P)-dependent dehydrogenase (short-subunit alcohol dehydrogenase family)
MLFKALHECFGAEAMTTPAILVTGGATRLGAAIVRGFAKAGWHIVIHYNSSGDAAQELAASLPSAEAIRCNLSDGDAAQAMIEQLGQRLPGLRCLVNSASVFRYDGPDSFDQILFDEAMQINAAGPARMAQRFLRVTLGAPLRTVIQVTDMKLANPNPDFFSYTMSKHAHAATIAMLAKHHARDSSARIYGLAPGAILASHDQDEEETAISHRLNLLTRKTAASEIVDAALFLASGACASGQTLYIDSGQHLMDQDRDIIYLGRDRAGAKA